MDQDPQMGAALVATWPSFFLSFFEGRGGGDEKEVEARTTKTTNSPTTTTFARLVTKRGLPRFYSVCAPYIR